MKTNILFLFFILVTSTAIAQINTDLFHEPFRLKANGSIIDVKQVGHSSPLIYDFNGDGVDDLLVGYFGDKRVEYDSVRRGGGLTEGKCQIYLNMGTNEKPEYTYSGELMAGGEVAYVPTDCCVGFTPFVADIDNDGIDDIISGSYPGQVYFFKGLGKGMYEKGEFLRDNTGKAFNPGHSNNVIAFDWDDDGDLDLIWGVRGGGLYLSINEGSKGKNSFLPPVKISLGRHKDHNRRFYTGASGVATVDWNNDGLFDLVCGTENGNVIVHINTGKKGFPDFSSLPEIIIEKESSYETAITGEEIAHGGRVKVIAYDYNGDGKMDLLVGDVLSTIDKKPNLTIEENIKNEELDKILRDLFYIQLKAYDELVKPRTTEIMEGNTDYTRIEAEAFAYNELPQETKESYYKVYDKIREAKKIQEPLRGRSRYHGFVWVYIRK